MMSYFKEHKDHKTIKHFGQQWQHFTDHKGFYGSAELFRDMLSSLIKVEDIQGKRALDIGSGAGRTAEMLLSAGAGHVVAVEPSKAAFIVLQQNLKDFNDRMTALNVKGDDIPDLPDIDFAFSIGLDFRHFYGKKPG